MGLEEHQNEAPGDEPQENTADYEEIRSSNQGEEKKPIQGNYEKEAGAQDISEQAGEAVPSDCSFQVFLHRHHLPAVLARIRVFISGKRHRQRRGGGLERLALPWHVPGCGNGEEHAPESLPRCHDPF